MRARGVCAVFAVLMAAGAPAARAQTNWFQAFDTSQEYNHAAPCLDLTLSPAQRLPHCQDVLARANAFDKDDIALATVEIDQALGKYAAGLHLLHDIGREMPIGMNEQARQALQNQLLRQRALTHALAGHYAIAKREADQAIAERPDYAAPYTMGCYVRAIDDHDLSQAMADCNKALSLTQSRAAIRSSRALVEFRQDRPGPALADANAALADNSGTYAALFLRGMIELRLNHTAKAADDLGTACQKDRELAPTFATMGIVPPSAAAAGCAGSD